MFDQSPLFSFGRRFHSLSKEEKETKKICYDPRIMTEAHKVEYKEVLSTPKRVIFNAFNKKLTAEMVSYCLHRVLNYDLDGIKAP